MSDFGTGEEFIWNLARDVAALLAELDTLFAKDPDSREGEGVLNTGGLLTTGVHGVEGLRPFVFCCCGVDLLPLFRLRDGCQLNICNETKKK